jgi:hypothetical protein
MDRRTSFSTDFFPHRVRQNAATDAVEYPVTGTVRTFYEELAQQVFELGGMKHTYSLVELTGIGGPPKE